MACGFGFPLRSVHQFESSRLSDMSNRLFVAVSTQIINGMLVNYELMELLYLILILLLLLA
jgi:hypothetical protein